MLTAAPPHPDVWTPPVQFAIRLVDAYATRIGIPQPAPAAGPMRFFFVASYDETGARHDYDTPLELAVRRNGLGIYVFANDVDTPDGVRRCDYFAAGKYRLRIAADLYQGQTIDIGIPDATAPRTVALEPGYRYPFPTANLPNAAQPPTLLRGMVAAADGRGVAGATVSVAGMDDVTACETDATGRWVLCFPPAQKDADVTLEIAGADRKVVQVPGVGIRGGKSASLGMTVVQGVLRDNQGRPVAGASVAPDGAARTVATNAAGAWSYTLPPDQGAAEMRFTAGLPDGRSVLSDPVHITPRVTQSGPVFTVPDASFPIPTPNEDLDHG